MSWPGSSQRNCARRVQALPPCRILSGRLAAPPAVESGPMTPADLRERLTQYERLMRLDKPIDVIDLLV